jgi:hypothetical protein
MVTCVVSSRRKLRQPHHHPPLSSPHLPYRQKTRTCNYCLLYLLQSDAAASLFFCISYQKSGSGLPPASPVNSPDNRLVPVSPPISASATPLLATLARSFACVAFKRLAGNLSSLLATLTKSRGRGSNQPYNSSAAAAEPSSLGGRSFSLARVSRGSDVTDRHKKQVPQFWHPGGPYPRVQIPCRSFPDVGLC